jgi:hypothetical protein
MVGTPFYHFGYALLFVPLYWLDLEPLPLFRIGLVLSALVATAVLPLLYLVGRKVLRLPRVSSLWVASIASLYPPSLLNSAFLWAENLLSPMFLAWLLAVFAFASRPVLVRGLGLAAVSIALYAVHPRCLILILVSALFLAFDGWQKRSARVSLPSILAMVVGFVLVEQGNRALLREIWQGQSLITPGGVAATLFDTSQWWHMLVIALGQIWYLFCATLGLIFFGVWFVGQLAVRRWGGRREADELGLAPAATTTLLILGLASAAMFGLSVVFSATGTRADHLVYGRYNDVAALPLVLLGLATVQPPVWRLGRIVKGFGASSLACVLVPLVFRLPSVVQANGDPVMALNVLGILWLREPGEWIDFGGVGWKYGVAVLLVGVAFAVLRRAAAILAGALFLVGAFVAEDKAIRPLVEGFPKHFRIASELEKRGFGGPIAYDSRSNAVNVHSYQFRLPKSLPLYFDAEAEDPPASVVVASTGWEGAGALGARLVASEWLSDHALWLLPDADPALAESFQRVQVFEAEDLHCDCGSTPSSKINRAWRPGLAGSPVVRYASPSVLGAQRRVVVYGPYLDLDSGTYRVTYELFAQPQPESETEEVVELMVTADAGVRVLASTKLVAAAFASDGRAEVELWIETPELVKQVETVVVYPGTGELGIDRIRLEPVLSKEARK